MTPSCCTSVAFGFIHLRLTIYRVSSITAWRSAELADFVGTWLSAWPAPGLRSCRSSCPSLACVVQRLVMVEL